MLLQLVLKLLVLCQISGVSTSVTLESVSLDSAELTCSLSTLSRATSGGTQGTFGEYSTVVHILQAF
jgi:hypothetical protein